MEHIGCDESCYGGIGTDATQKRVRLAFDREELLYDIKNCAYVEGHVWEDAPLHARHELQDIGEDGNVDRVNRVLAAAHAEVADLLLPYAEELCESGTEIGNAPEMPEVYEINMTVPQGMSATTLRLLSKTIHEYMVSRVLSDWLGMTHPEAAMKWERKALEAEEQIKGLKHRRDGGVMRRRSYPW